MDPSSQEAGRTAPAERLALELATAPAPYLEGALDNPSFGPDHVLVLLKNRAASGALIQRMSRNASWVKPYEVKAAIVLHLKTPRVTAMNLVPFLWWRDLARVADHPGLAPPLKRAAERILTVRLQELALGEQVSLARVASRGLVPLLRRQNNPLVLRALLQNPHLVEEDALAIASAPTTPAGVLRALAEDPRFSLRPAVTRAIAQNPETPAPTALRIIQHLSVQGLTDLLRAPHLPNLVRVAVTRLLETRQGAT